MITPDVPQYGIAVQEDADGQLWMGLNIASSSINVMAYLCRSDVYEEVARNVHKQIMEAGAQMRREERKRKSGLVVAKGAGDVDAAVQTERRVKRGPRSAG